MGGGSACRQVACRLVQRPVRSLPAALLGRQRVDRARVHQRRAAGRPPGYEPGHPVRHARHGVRHARLDRRRPAATIRGDAELPATSSDRDSSTAWAPMRTSDHGPGLRAAVAGLGGAVLAIGVLVGGRRRRRQPRASSSASSLALIAAALGAAPVREGRRGAVPPSVGMVVVGIPVFATAATVSDGAAGFAHRPRCVAALFLGRVGAAGLPGPQPAARPRRAGAGRRVRHAQLSDDEPARQVQTVHRRRATSTASTRSARTLRDRRRLVPAARVTDNLGDAGHRSTSLGAALFLGLTWWLDRRGYRGTGTALVAAGLRRGDRGHGAARRRVRRHQRPDLRAASSVCWCAWSARTVARRATTWWGAALLATGIVALVAVVEVRAGLVGAGWRRGRRQRSLSAPAAARHRVRRRRATGSIEQSRTMVPATAGSVTEVALAGEHHGDAVLVRPRRSPRRRARCRRAG